MSEDWEIDCRDDVRDALTARGWKVNDQGALVKNGAWWSEVNGGLDSGLDGPGKRFVVEFLKDVPAEVIVAACEAAAA